MIISRPVAYSYRYSCCVLLHGVYNKKCINLNLDNDNYDDINSKCTNLDVDHHNHYSIHESLETYKEATNT